MRKFSSKKRFVVLARAGCFVLMLGTLSLLVYMGIFKAAGSSHRVLVKVQTEAGSVLPSNDWNLTLVNPWNTLPDQYPVCLQDIGNGNSMDERCCPELERMLDDCRASGLEPLVCSAYRSQNTQEELFQAEVDGWISQGYSREEAEKEAGKVVAVPGTSEHQLGLAADIVDATHQLLDESQEDTEVQKWLMENSWKYGFILRYPSDKSNITGIIYEPWHYRYVGKEAAQEIYEQEICLEEYLEPQKKETTP